MVIKQQKGSRQFSDRDRVVLTKYAKRIALFEAEGYRPPTIAKMLKSEMYFRKEWLSFIRNIRNLLVCFCWALSSKTHVKETTRVCIHSPVPENGNGKIKTKWEYVRNGPVHSSPVQYPFAARVFLTGARCTDRTGELFFYAYPTCMCMCVYECVHEPQSLHCCVSKLYISWHRREKSRVCSADDG